MSRALPCLTVLLLLARCLAPSPTSAAAAPPADGPRPLAKLAGPAGTAVAFSRDGKLILTAGGDSARVWDARTFEPVTPPLKHKDGEELYLAALSPDGKFVLTVVGNEARVWDVAKGERISVLRREEKVRSASFSRDSAKILTAGDDRTARVWTVSGRQLAAYEHPGAVVYAVFSPDGRKVLTVVQGQVKDQGVDLLHVWDLSGGVEVWRTGSDQLSVPDGDLGDRRYRGLAAFSPDGSRVAAASFRDLVVRDAADGHTVAYADTVDDAGATTVVAFSPDGKSVVAGTQMGCVIYEVPSGDAPPEAAPVSMKRAQKFADWVALDDVGFSGDGRFVVTATRGNFDGTGVWRVSSEWPPRLGRGPTLILPYRKHFDEAPAVAFSPDGRRVAAGFASDGYTAVWEVPEGKRP